jgi:hypothetical protein
MPYWTYYHRDNQKNLDNDKWIKGGWEKLDPNVDDYNKFIKDKPNLDANNIKRFGKIDLPFYPGFSLYEIVPDDFYPIPQYYLIKDDKSVFFYLDGQRKTLSEINKKCSLTLSQSDQEKTDTLIKDYLYLYLSHLQNPKGRYMLCEALEQIRWRFTLSDDENKYYQDLLTPIKLDPYEQTGHYDVTLNAIQGDTLFKLKLSLWPNGDICILSRKVLARYLPVIKDALGDFREGNRSGNKEPFNLEAGWQLFSSEEYDNLGKLFHNIFPEKTENDANYKNRLLKRIWHKNKLGFFPTASLLRLDFDIVDDEGNSIEPLDTGFGIYILKGTVNRYYLLHGTSIPIYCAIEFEDLVVDDTNVLDFTRFFCSFIHSSGPFNILMQASDLNALQSPSSVRNDDKSIDENLTYDEITLAEIENICKEPKPRNENEENTWEIDATVQFYDGLYNAKLTLDLDYKTKGKRSMFDMGRDQAIFINIPVDNTRTICPAFNLNEVIKFDKSISLFADFPYGRLFTDEQNGNRLIKKWESARLSKVSYGNEFIIDLRERAGKTNQEFLKPRLVLPPVKKSDKENNDIDLHGIQFEDELVLKDFFFLCPLNLNDIEVKSFVDFSGSVFIDPHVYTKHDDIKPALTMNDSRIDGCFTINKTLYMSEVSLERCKMQGSLFADNSYFSHGINAPHITVEGDSHISESKFYRNLNFQNAYIKGRFFLDNAFINGDLSVEVSEMNSLELTDIELKGNLTAWNTNIHSGCILMSLNKKLLISGDVNMILSKIGWLTFRAIEVAGRIDLHEAEISQNLNIISAPVSADLGAKAWLLQPTIASAIDASGCRVQGNTIIRGVELGFTNQNPEENDIGKLVLDHANLDGHLNLSWDSIEKVRLFYEKKYLSGDDDLKPISNSKSVFCKLKNSLSLVGTTVKGNVDLHGIQVGDGNNSKDEKHGLIDLTSAEIFGKTTCADFTIQSTARIKAKCSQVDMRHLKTHNDIDFSGLNISGKHSLHNSSDKKSLDAVSAKIEGSLIFCDKRNPPQSKLIKGKIMLHGAEIDHLRISGNGISDSRDKGIMPLEQGITSEPDRNKLAGFAFTFSFILIGIGISSIGYNLFLNGAEEFGLEPFDLSVFVLMCICFWLAITLLRISFSLTHIANCLCPSSLFSNFFSNLTTQECTFRDFMRIISFNTLFLPADHKKQPASLSLTNTSIGHFEIVDSIPALMDLTNLQVKRWTDANTKKSSNFDFPEFLLSANAFNRSNYYSIEKYLRNNGYQEAADQIRRTMHDTDRMLEKSGLYNLKNFLHSFIGYGTQVKKLIALMVIWLVFSCVWFWQIFPKSFELNTSYIFQVANLNKELVNPNLDKKQKAILETAISKIDLNQANKLEAITGLVIRYHVPILNIDLTPYIEPKTDWLKGYTLLVTISHWIFWPVLLTSLIRSLLPNRE